MAAQMQPELRQEVCHVKLAQLRPLPSLDLLSSGKLGLLTIGTPPRRVCASTLVTK